MSTPAPTGRAGDAPTLPAKDYAVYYSIFSGGFEYGRSAIPQVTAPVPGALGLSESAAKYIAGILNDSILPGHRAPLMLLWQRLYAAPPAEAARAGEEGQS